jgi:hypothetical protein
MTVALLIAALALTDPAEAPARPPALPFFADEDWYQKATPKETTFDGTIERTPTSGQIGKPARFNTYRLTWTTPDGTKMVREVYTPGKSQLLTAHLGKRVRIVGKAVDTTVEGKTYAEIWPARLETSGLQSPDMQAGIQARCGWQPTSAKRRGGSHWVVTSGSDLAKHFGYFGRDVDQRVTGEIAREFKVPAIDWKKQMLVGVAAGMHINGERLHITRVQLVDKVLLITYRLEKPKEATPGLGYPAETVLVDRFDGDVKFQAETKKAE